MLKHKTSLYLLYTCLILILSCSYPIEEYYTTPYTLNNTEKRIFDEIFKGKIGYYSLYFVDRIHWALERYDTAAGIFEVDTIYVSRKYIKDGDDKNRLCVLAHELTHRYQYFYKGVNLNDDEANKFLHYAAYLYDGGKNGTLFNIKDTTEDLEAIKEWINNYTK